MTEQQIQTKLIKELEGNGYYVIKLISTNKNGIPDLIAIPKDSSVEFYEVKKQKGKVSKLQEYRLKELRAHGIKVEIYKGIESNDNAQAHQDGGPVSNS
jgi:Holliday junction resolvase